MKIKRLLQLAVSGVISLSSLLALSMPLAHAAGPFTCTWTGGGTTDNFSDAANWSGCNSAAPQSADSDNLIFPAASAATNSTPHNNLTSATFTSITVSGSAEADFAIDGNAFVLTNGITVSGANASLAIGNNIALSTINLSEQTFTVSTGSVYGLYISGALTGGADLVKNGTAPLVLDADNSNWGGSLTANAGSLIATQANSFGSSSGGGVTVNSGADLTLSSCDSFTLAADLNLTGNSTLAVGDFPAPKLGSSVGCDGDGFGFSDEIYGSFDNGDSSSVTLSGSIVLGSDITFAGTTGTTTITGSITGAHAITMLPGYTGKLVVASNSNGSHTVNGTYTPGQFTKTITDSSSATVEIFGNNVITIDGTRGDTIVWKGGILQGTGTLGTLDIEDKGIVAPGHSPGCLSSGDLTLTGIYQAQIGGTTACSGYDQLKVTGTVDVTSGTLTPTLYNGFVPAVGQSYTIITNDGSDVVTGTFNGIAEGGTVTNDGITYTITYKGGDGNDVVLTVKSVDASKLPAKPNTGLSLVAAHPLVTLGVSAAAALTLIFTSRRLKPTRR